MVNPRIIKLRYETPQKGFHCARTKTAGARRRRHRHSTTGSRAALSDAPRTLFAETLNLVKRQSEMLQR